MSSCFQIFIRNLQNASLTFDVSLTDSIQTIKDHIQTREGIPSVLQRLVFQGKELRDKYSIQEANLQKNDSVYLMLSLKGGGNTKSSNNLDNIEKKIYYSAHNGRTTSMIVSKDSRHIISGSEDGSITVFDIESKEAEREKLHLGDVETLAVTKDKRYIISSSHCRGKFLKVTEFNLKNSVHKIREVSATTSMEVSKDDKHVVCGKSDGSLMVYSLATTKCVFTIANFMEDAITSLIIRENYVFCGAYYGFQTIKIFSLGNKRCLRSFKDLAGSRASKLLAVSENSKYIVQTCDQDLLVFNAFNGKLIKHTPQVDESKIQSVLISKNNKFIITINMKAIIKFFDLFTGKCLFLFNKERFVSPDFPILKLASDNRYLALADWKGAVKILCVVGENILADDRNSCLRQNSSRELPVIDLC